MIKVNLLRAQTERVRVTAVRPSVSSVGLLMVSLALVAAAGVAGWSYTISQETARLALQRDRLRGEHTRLQALRKQVVEYEKLKAMQQNRIDVIHGLKQSQTGPVLLLNHVLHSIPRDANVWLSTLDQKGDRVHITGFAHHSEAIPDLMSNLASSGIFKSVDLENLEQDKGKDATKFSLVCVAAQAKASTE